MSLAFLTASEGLIPFKEVVLKIIRASGLPKAAAS